MELNVELCTYISNTLTNLNEKMKDPLNRAKDQKTFSGQFAIVE